MSWDEKKALIKIFSLDVNDMYVCGCASGGKYDKVYGRGLMNVFSKEENLINN